MSQDNSEGNIFLGLFGLVAGAMICKAVQEKVKENPRKADKSRIKQEGKKNQNQNQNKVERKQIQANKTLKEPMDMGGKKQVSHKFAKCKPTDFQQRVKIEKGQGKTVDDPRMGSKKKQQANPSPQQYHLDHDDFEIDQDGFPKYNPIYFQDFQTKPIQNKKNSPRLESRNSVEQVSGCFLEADTLHQLLLCPISSTIMKQPVIISTCGHTYERKQIQSWLNSHSTCPLCNKRSSKINIVPNIHLKQIIEQYQHKQKKAKE